VLELASYKASEGNQLVMFPKLNNKRGVFWSDATYTPALTGLESHGYVLLERGSAMP